MSNLWSQCLDQLQNRVNEHTFSTWLEPIHCEKESDRGFVLSCPNKFFISWVKDNYFDLITNTLFELTETNYTINFLSRDDFGSKSVLQDSNDQSQSATEPKLSQTDNWALQKNLNPNYTFERFVVGDCNQFAKAASMAVSDNLGSSYNPLFLYGGVGLGKTHLMSATGYAVLSTDRTKRVSFSTSEEFTNEMINAIRFDRMVGFREKYRNVDLLLIDDVQFIAGKERTQEEFFHTINTVCENGKQIVLTSDRPPNEIPDIEHRLRTRFSWGLIASLGLPDLETRVAILKRKAYDDSVDLPDDVAYFLAQSVASNVRELTGCLIRVIAMSTLQGVPLSVDLAQNAVEDIIPRHVKQITIEEIISTVAKAYNVKASDIKSKKKHKRFSFPRQVAMFLSRELTEYSYPEIGAAFGGKDHSTVIHATRKIEQSIETDPMLRNTVDRLKTDIRG